MDGRLINCMVNFLKEKLQISQAYRSEHPIWFNFKLFKEDKYPTLAAFLQVPDSLIQFVAIQLDQSNTRS